MQTSSLLCNTQFLFKKRGSNGIVGSESVTKYVLQEVLGSCNRGLLSLIVVVHIRIEKL